MVMLCRDEYTELDIDRVIKMALVHDLGEAVIGNIPSFEKTDADFEDEHKVIIQLFSELPEPSKSELMSLYEEYGSQITVESKLCKALDNLEAVLQHNEAPIETWISLEYDLQLTYGKETASFSEWTDKLRKELNNDTLIKTDMSERDD